MKTILSGPLDLKKKERYIALFFDKPSELVSRSKQTHTGHVLLATHTSSKPMQFYILFPLKTIDRMA